VGLGKEKTCFYNRDGKPVESLYIGLRKGEPTVMAWNLSRINDLTYIEGH
jgi:hypothetical protein